MWVRGDGLTPPGAWVLVTDDVTGQNRAAVSTVRALARAGYRPAVSTSGPGSVAAASRYCQRRIQLPRAGTSEYAAALAAELAGGDYVAALPASDVSVIALDLPAAPLVNKAVLSERATDAGFLTLPETIFESGDDLRAAAHDLTYPALVKAVVKTGHSDTQARRLDGPCDLAGLAAGGPLIVQPFEFGGLSAVAGVVWEGEFLALSHQRYVRLWPRRAGVGSAAVTVGPDLDVEDRLLRLLAGHNGVFQVQFVGPYLVDVNPRVFGSMPLALAAGANLPGLACDAARGRRALLVRARAGVHYRWFEGDLRHLLQAVRTKEISAAMAAHELRPLSGTAHSIESLSDPKPVLNRLAYAARRSGR